MLPFSYTYQELFDLQDALTEYCNDSYLDICNDIPASDFARNVLCIAVHLKYQRNVNYGFSFETEDSCLLVSVAVFNVRRGSVVVSVDYSTAISKTLYYPFMVNEDSTLLDALQNLADMISEAYYHAINS